MNENGGDGPCARRRQRIIMPLIDVQVQSTTAAHAGRAWYAQHERGVHAAAAAAVQQQKSRLLAVALKQRRLASAKFGPSCTPSGSLRQSW
jgi:hypothetical protein